MKVLVAAAFDVPLEQLVRDAVELPDPVAVLEAHFRRHFDELRAILLPPLQSPREPHGMPSSSRGSEALSSPGGEP